jgi:O-antigen/teichoic acid export membrane protein
MIGEMSGNTELGIYSVAVLIAEVLYFIPMVINSSVFPSIVEAKGISDDFFYARLQKLYNLMAFLAYGVALPITFLAGWLIPFLFGTVYSKAGPMLIGLVWAGVFINFMITRSYYLTAMNWTRLHFIIDFLGCVLNVSLNFFLIPRYGGMGAVVASFITYWFVVHGLCFVFKPLHKTGTMMTKAMLYPKIW